MSPGLPILDQFQTGQPQMMYLPAAIGLISGLILLLAGGKLLRPAAALLGAGAGAFAGSATLPAFLPQEVFGIPAPAAAMGIGGLVGVVAALVLFRAAMAAAGAVTFAAAGVLACAICTGGLPTAPSLKSTIVDNNAPRLVLASLQDQPSQLQANAESLAPAARQLAQTVWGDAQSAWSSLPAESQWRLIGSGLGAGLVGLIIGAIMPRKAAALLTSLLGAGVFLASLAWISQMADLPGRALLDQGPTGSLAMWAVVAVAGLAFQLASQARPRKAAPGFRPVQNA
jgi:hypothetical protein